MKKIALVLLSSVAVLWSMTVNGSLSVLGTLTASVVDFSGAAATQPVRKANGVPVGNCAQGEVYFQADSLPGMNLHVCSSTDTWTAVGGGGTGGGGKAMVEPKYVQISDEFGVPAASFTGNGTWRGASTAWSFSGSGNIGAYQTSTWPNLGVVRLSSGSGTSAHLNQSDIANSIAWGTLPTNQSWAYYLVFRFPAAADYDSAAQTWIMVGGYSGTPPGGFGIRRTAAETNWQLVLKSGDGTQVTDSGWAATDTNWHTLKIRSDGTAAGKVWVSLDGGAEKSICVSGCNANAGAGWWTAPTPAGFYIYQSATAGNTRNLAIDYFGFEATAGLTGGRRN